ncbi:major tail protein [Staphylococcus phage Stau2]|uniref:Hydrolase domain protein n=1 Tax=Staphylococcus phage Stau2 TaxID=1200862 RepID=A0A0U1ZYM6_9CAUD|nr:major tail protein [Staphylococcus phage Stau2]AKA61403.1 hydrolase domain protein [Staphylococcus phage Stau2]WAW11888.1 hypothetical protein [Staphylococcus phage StAP1]WAW12103.1 hypothetical protein [Staphylococcus phage SAP6]
MKDLTCFLYAILLVYYTTERDNIMSKKLKVYNKEEQLILTSDEVTGSSVKVTLTDLKPNTTYNKGDFKVSWLVDGQESNKTDVPSFKTLESEKEAVAQPVIVNTLDMGTDGYTISNEPPKDTNKIWLKSE